MGAFFRIRFSLGKTIMPDYSLSRIIHLHKKVSGRFKQYEQAICNYPPPDVLNEFRYALRALIEILELFENNSIDEEKKKADFEHAEEKVHHALQCAYHDLIDGLHEDTTTTMADLTNNYLEETIFGLGNKRMEIIDTLNDISEVIVRSRESPSKRYEIYDEELFDKWFITLMNHRRYLYGRATQDIITLHNNKKTEEEAVRLAIIKKERKQTILTWLGITIGIIGILIGIVGVFWPEIKSFYK